MDESNTNFYNKDNELDFKKLFQLLWDAKYFIGIFTAIFALISVFYALSLPNIYTSTALLVPSNDDESLSSRVDQYSSIASLAGVNISNQNVPKSKEAIARIQSFEFFSNHFLPDIKLEDLLAYKEWVPQSNKSIYDGDAFDKESGKWIREVAYPKQVIPSDQEAFKAYKEMLTVNEDKRTAFVVLSAKHKSPFIAQEWLEIIIKNINESMREENKKTAQNAINFLNESSSLTNIQSLKEAISILLESQMQTLMLASTYEDYVFKAIDSPIAPELKSSPNRAYICIIGTLTAGILSLFLVLLNYLWRVYKY